MMMAEVVVFDNVNVIIDDDDADEVEEVEDDELPVMNT